jgi:hypothetical protein
MLVVVVAGFPLILLALMLSMERVERPLRDEAVVDRVEPVLASGRPDEVETIVSTGAAVAVDRYWRRVRRRGRLFARRVGSA